MYRNCRWKFVME